MIKYGRYEKVQLRNYTYVCKWYKGFCVKKYFAHESISPKSVSKEIKKGVIYFII